MWNRIVRFAQPSFVLAIGLTLIFWQNFSTLLPGGVERIVGITIALGAGLIFYFDHRLDALSPRHRALDHINMAAGIARAVEHVREPRSIRIFALSTFVIQPLLRDLGVKTRECALLLYEPDRPPEQDAGGPPTPQARMPLAPVQEWIDMKSDGAIDELEIRGYGFYPLDYFILFEDRALLTGRYLIRDQRFPRCEVQEPCLVLDETPEGKILIRKYLEVFESLRNSKMSYPIELDAGVSPGSRQSPMELGKKTN